MAVEGAASRYAKKREKEEKENLFNAAYKSVLLNIFTRLTSHSFQLSLYIAIILALNT